MILRIAIQGNNFLTDKDEIYLLKLRSNQIGGLRQFEKWLGLPSSIVDRSERPLVYWLRDNGIKFDDALRVLKSHYGNEEK